MQGHWFDDTDAINAIDRVRSAAMIANTLLENGSIDGAKEAVRDMLDDAAAASKEVTDIVRAISYLGDVLGMSMCPYQLDPDGVSGWCDYSLDSCSMEPGDCWCRYALREAAPVVTLCPNCNGDGEFTDHVYEYEPCEECGGEGCDFCAFIGEIETEVEIFVSACTVCDGTGERIK